jgi:Ca2+-binding EF-hand superfamily protein
MKLTPNRYFAITAIALTAVTQTLAQRSSQGMGPLLDRAQVKQGDTIPSDLILYTADGTETTLAKIVSGKFTVLVSGCLTCPIFHRSYPGVEAVYQDYKARDDIQFFFMYKSLAHPELNGYVQAMTIEERLQHIVEAKRVLGTTIDWLCDGMDNAVRHTLGFGPNTQIVIDPSGKIVHSLGWSDGTVLREQIISFVGDTATRTKVADLNLKKERPYRRQRSYEPGVLEKPTFSSELIPIKITPIENARSPLYVKPRVEVGPSVLQNGEGELYLGFFLDPIHHVHWNNLAAPLKYEFTLNDGTVISPAAASAPKVGQETDRDPREFALSVSGLGDSKTAELAIHYFACSDEEGWCRPVTQRYAISFERDLDGGGTNGRSFRVVNNGGRGQVQRRPGGPPRGNQAGGIEQMRQRILEMDSNQDGEISLEEAPEQMKQRFAQMDQNSDGKLDKVELETMFDRRARQGNQGRRPGQGQPQGPQSIKERVMGADSNSDGLISEEELPAQMQQRFEQMDANGDGFVDEQEIDEMLRNRPGPRSGQGRPRGAGGRI